MDRCRCADYEAAVKKIRFFTVGTHRPEYIENYDREYWLNIRLEDAAAADDIIAVEEEKELKMLSVKKVFKNKELKTLRVIDGY